MAEHRLANILRAIADGKVVQVRTITRYPHPRGEEQGDWTALKTDEAFSLFPGCSGHEYRIKPKPKVKKWRWVVEDNKGNLSISKYHYSSGNEFENLFPGTNAIQHINSTMIEVEEDDE